MQHKQAHASAADRPAQPLEGTPTKAPAEDRFTIRVLGKSTILHAGAQGAGPAEQPC